MTKSGTQIFILFAALAVLLVGGAQGVLAQEGRLPVFDPDGAASPYGTPPFTPNPGTGSIEIMGPLGPFVVDNVLVNSPAADTPPPGSRFTQSETSTISFNNGTQDIVLVAYNDSGSLDTPVPPNGKFTGWARSTDGGVTFTDLGVLPTVASGDSGDPVLARDNFSGTIYLATLQFAGSGIGIWRSFDDGLTFTGPPQGAPGQAGFQDKPWITVDNWGGPGQGNVYHVVRDFGPGDDIAFFRSTDGGATYGPAGGLSIASGVGGNVQGPFVTVAPNHAVDVYWFSDVGGPQTLRHRRSTDRGLTFGPPNTIATLTTTLVNGRLVASPPAFRTNSFLHAAVNPVTGALYVIYNQPGGGGDLGDIFFRRSTDGGTSWSAPARVNSDTGTNMQWQPTLAVSPDGSKVFAGWYDRRLDPADTMIDAFGAIGTIDVLTNMVTFGENFRLSDVSFPPVFGIDGVVNATYMGDYDTAVADNANFYFSWADNRLGTPDVRMVKIPYAQFPTTIVSANDSFGNGKDNGTPDNFTLMLDPTTGANVQVFIEGSLSTEIPVAGLAGITVLGSSDDDTLTVDTTNGLIDLPNGIRFLGGAGIDALDLLQTGGAPHTTELVAPGTAPGSGVSIITDLGGPTQTIDFSGLEPFVTNVPAVTFSITSVPGLASQLQADNQIDYDDSPLFGPTWGRVTVDSFEPIDFINKQNLVIDAGAGSDEVHLNHSGAPTGLIGTIDVNGNAPTGSSDHLVVRDRGLGTPIIYTSARLDQVPPATVMITGAQVPQVNATTFESIHIEGQGGNDTITVNATGNPDVITFIAGATIDSGAIQIQENTGPGTGISQHVPMTFSNLGGFGSVTVAGLGGTVDQLVYEGSASDDNFSVAGTGTVTLVNTAGSHVPVISGQVNGMESLTLVGHDGDDTFNVGPVANFPVSVQGNGASAHTNVLNFPAVGATTVDLGTSSVNDAAILPAPNVFYSGVDVINVTTPILTVLGTGGDDTLLARPASATSAVVTAPGHPVVNGLPGIGTFTVDANGGQDTIVVEANEFSNTISASDALVSIVGLLPVNLLNEESLTVSGQQGNDTITVTPSGTVPIFVDGGDPIGQLQDPTGDILNVMNLGSAFIFDKGPEGDEGTVNVGANQPVSFDKIEALQENGVLYILPDAKEPNDTIATATVLGSVPQITVNDLTLHDTGVGPLVINEDFFKITAPATGKMSINAFFDDNFAAMLGNIDIEVQDAGGGVIVSSTTATDNEMVVFPVVNQQMYFLRVFSVNFLPNTYDLEIETFAAPTPALADLVDASDTGMMNDDDVTADSTPTFQVQADLTDFFNMGITIDGGAGVPGADVTMSATSQTTGGVTTVDAARVLVVNNNLWTATFPVLADDEYLIEAWVRIEDGQAVPVVGRGSLSPSFTVTIDTMAPVAPLAPDMLDTSDDGASSTDNITSINAPAFDGLGEPNAKVRVYADGELVGQSVVTTFGTWEITIEPVGNGAYAITAELEDLAGNISPMSPPLAIIVDPMEPNNTIQTATVLGSIPKITLNDVTLHDITDIDVFKITAMATGKLMISAFYDLAGGDVALSIQDAAGNPITAAVMNLIPGMPEQEQIVIPVVNQEMYYLVVTLLNDPDMAVNEGNLYDLEIESFMAPTPALPDLAAADDTGMMDDDDVTNNPNPSFFVQADLADFAAMGIPINMGVGVPGAEVFFSATLQPGGIVVQTEEATSPPANPNLWTASFVPALPDGVYFIEAWVRMEDGQVLGGPHNGRGPLSPPLTVTIDTTAPAAPSVPDLLASSDSGLSSTDNITNKMEPAFSGTGMPNAKVRVYANGLLVGQSVITTAGNWEITVEPLVDGVYAITAEQEDLAGNVSPMSAAMAPALTVDTIAPQRPTIDLPDIVDTGTSSFDNVTHTPDPVPFVISAELRVPPTRVLVKDGEIVVIPVFDFDAAFDLTDGIPGNGLGIVFIDFAANFGAFGIPTEGNHPLSVEAIDVAGNISAQAEELALEVDRTAPAIPAPVDLNATSDTGMDPTDNVTAINQPALSGVVFGTLGDAPLKVFLWDGAALIGETDIVLDFPFPNDSRAFEITTEPLADGVHMIQASAEDLAGNISPFSPPFQIEIDTLAPNLPFLDLFQADDTGHDFDDNITNVNVPRLSATTEDPNAGTHIFPANFKYRVFDRFEGAPEVQIYDSFMNLGDFSPLDQIWTTANTLFGASVLPVLADGTHNLKLEVEDRAGNISPDFLLDVVIDTVVPAAPAFDLAQYADSGTLGDCITNINPPAFVNVGPASEPGSIWMFADGVQVGMTDVNGATNLNWEVTVEPVYNNMIAFTAHLEDWAGNTSPLANLACGGGILTMDTIDPQLPSIDLQAAHDTGAYNDDNVTNWANPISFDVRADATDMVVVKDGNTIIDGPFASTGLDVRALALAEGVHILTVEATDTAGNIRQSEVLQVLVDRTDPGDPAGVTVTSHTIGVPSNTTVIDVEWMQAANPGVEPSNLFGYSHEFNNTAVPTCDSLKDHPLDPTVTSISSPPLADGSWWFHICTGDIAGNWTSTAVAGAVIIDTVSPYSMNINSVADTGDGTLAFAEETTAGITQIVVTFDDKMNDPAGDTELDDVTNPINYLLVRAGFDETFQTETCLAGPAGDDVEIVVNAATYDDPSSTVHLVVNNGFPLDEDWYSVLLCNTNSMSTESETFGLEDVAGNHYDGDFDGVGNDDEVHDFHVTATNVLVNPNFDFGIGDWVATAPGDTTHDATIDAGMVMNSGSLKLTSAGGDNKAITQCVLLGDDREYKTGGQVSIMSGSATDPKVTAMVDFFQTGDCSGPILSTSSSTPVAGDTAGAFVAPATLTALAHGSAGSALVTFMVDGMSGPAPAYMVHLDSLFFYGSATPVAMAAGQIDGILGDDLVVDFGPGKGVKVYYNNTPPFVSITPFSGEGLVIGDLDATGKAEVVVDFGALGMWAWSNNASWFQMTGINPGAMTTADVDNDGRFEVIAEFDDLSVWIAFNYTGWLPISAERAETLASGDVDGNGQGDVIADFGPQGLWIYFNNTNWVQISSLNVDGLGTGDMTGDGKDEVLGDFGVLGVWAYSQALGWQSQSVANPEGFASGDRNGTGKDEIWLDLGPNRGIWENLDDTGYLPLTFFNPDAIASGDLDNDGHDELIGDFGASPPNPVPGIWAAFTSSGAWSQITPDSP